MNIFNKNLKSYLTLLSVLLCLLISGVTIYSFLQNFNEYYKQQQHNVGLAYLQNNSSHIQRKLDRAMTLLKTTSSSSSIHESINSLSEKNNSGIQDYLASKRILENLLLVQSKNTIIDDVIIFSDVGQFSARGNSFSEKFRYSNLPNQREISHLMTPEQFINELNFRGVQNFNFKIDNYAGLQNKLLLATNMFDQNNQFIGLLIITLNPKNLEETLLNSERVNIKVDNKEVFTGTNYDNTNPELIVTHQVFPYNVFLSYKHQDLLALFSLKQKILIFLIIILVFSITYMIVLRISFRFLEPLDALVEWIKAYITNGKDLNKLYINNKYSLRERIFAFLIIATLVPSLLISLTFYYQASYYILEVEKQSEIERIEERSKLINDEIIRLKKTLSVLVANQYSNNYRRNENYLQIQDDVNKFDELEGVMISIIDNSGKLLMSTRDQNKIEITIDNFLQEKERSRYLIGTINYDNKRLFSLMLPLKLSKYRDEHLEYMVLSVDQQFFNKVSLVDNIIKESLLFGREKWYITNENESESKTYHSKLTESNIHYEVDYSDEIFKKNLSNVFWRNSYLYIIMILLLLVVSYLISNRLMIPFEKIIKEQAKFPNYNLKLISNIQIDEVEILKNKFMERIQEINELSDAKLEVEKKVIETQFEKKEIQLLAIQNQVNPHFLYNTLENLIYLVESGENEKAVNMIVSLSRFFQFITNRSNYIITLEEEINFSKHYIEIMKVRFDNFEVKWNVKVNNTQLPILKMLLQPIIENSIHHGVKNSNHFINIEIIIIESAQYLLIEIKDNADGIEKEKLKKLQEGLKNSEYNRSGIYNVNDRLSLYYQDNYHLDIKSKKGQGTVVTIKINNKGVYNVNP